MPVILITGCSSGIGRAIARAAVRRGFTTIATSRNVEALGALEAEGCVIRRLDVTDDSARRDVVNELISSYGAIDVLVNNAGYGELGPCEEVPIERWGVQFETNVFGPVGLIQLVLPGMRSRGYGRIVNISSMAGELVLPVGAAYHGSKYALEAATEVLRLAQPCPRARFPGTGRPRRRPVGSALRADQEGRSRRPRGRRGTICGGFARRHGRGQVHSPAQ
jgi:NAD(P)-dependent dehydrogenase (short-subunit alcohol dehydrogenase family)